MWWLNSVLFGLAAGLSGVAMWAAIVFRSGHHLGRFAFAVGVLVGAGVRLGVEGPPETEHGVIAAALGIVCILLGKYAAAHWMAARLRLTMSTDDDS